MLSVGKIACILGLHKWEFKEETIRNDATGEQLVYTMGRCKRDCPTYTKWRIVNLNQRRPW